MNGGFPLDEKFSGDRMKPLGYTTGTLSGWATATDGVARVDVYIPAGPDKLFGRMRVTMA